MKMKFVTVRRLPIAGHGRRNERLNDNDEEEHADVADDDTNAIQARIPNHVLVDSRILATQLRSQHVVEEHDDENQEHKDKYEHLGITGLNGIANVGFGRHVDPSR